MKKILLFTVLFFVQDLYPDSIAQVIDTPGHYTFSNDLEGDPTDPNDFLFIIAANGVTIDLASRTFRQKPGNTTAVFSGIFIQPNLSKITIKNGGFDNFTGIGIYVSDGCQEITLQNLGISSCEVAAMGFFGLEENRISKCTIDHCQTSSCSSAIMGGEAQVMFFRYCEDMEIRNCSIYDNTNVGTFWPLHVRECIDSRFDNIDVKNNHGGSLAAFALINGSNNLYSNCSAIGNTVTPIEFDSYIWGFLLSGSTFRRNIFLNCLAYQNSGAQQAVGFVTDGNQSDVLFQNCKSLQNRATDDSYGFFLAGTATRNNFIDCIAEGNVTDDVFTGTQAMGFRVRDAESCKFVRCISVDQLSGIAVGFDFSNTTSCVVHQCEAYRNNGNSDSNSYGFRINNGVTPDTGLNLFIGNKAANNGLIAANQMNNFISGTTTNIPYSDLNTVTAPFTNLGIVP